MNRLCFWFALLTYRLIGHNSVPLFTVQALSTLTPNLKSDNKASLQKNGLKGKMILAPLTRGGNLPFRRLCADFGMEVSLSEMIYARSLLKGDSVEQARLRRASNEQMRGQNIIQHC